MLAAALSPVGGDDAGRRVRRELETGGYRHDDPGPLERVLHWIGEQLGSLLGGGGGNSGLRLVLLVLAVVAAGFVVRAGMRGRLRHRRGPDRTTATPDPLAPTTSRDHRAAALRHERDGDRGEALREWLRAAIATIEEHGVLLPRPGRTGAATAREASPRLGAAAEPLTRAVTGFEQVWFGGRIAGDDDVTAARTAADLVAASRGGRAAGPSAVRPAAAQSHGFVAPW